jgi:hypothetical protein
MNPLISINKLTDSEIEQKIQDLSRKYFMTHNPEIQLQILSFLNIHKEELSNRRALAWEKQFQKSNKGLDKLINVN